MANESELQKTGSESTGFGSKTKSEGNESTTVFRVGDLVRVAETPKRRAEYTAALRGTVESLEAGVATIRFDGWPHRRAVPASDMVFVRKAEDAKP